MFQFTMPAILIAISIGVFVVFTNPIFKDISSLREDMSGYDEALGNSKKLESEREKLTQKYNAIGEGNLDKLQKLLPSHVDNIRLILEIEKLATPYGMVLKDVKYDATEKESPKGFGIVGGLNSPGGVSDYGVWNLQFSTEGSYSNFLRFVKDIENNLRIVDITSVSFSSNNQGPDFYKYSFNIKTYWLKN